MRILKEGFPFILPSFFAGAILTVVSILFITNKPAYLTGITLGSISIAFAVFCIFFFRDPAIKITQGKGLILSPCNGTIMEIIKEGEKTVIRTFLSIFNVHLQRSPVGGKVIDVNHKDGKFLAAWNPNAHIENEQNLITIEGRDDEFSGVYIVQQIAGFVARRCVTWVKTGDVLNAGDKIGMIKFSSQVDLYLPGSFDVCVKPGDKIRAGITVMAKK